MLWVGFGDCHRAGYHSPSGSFAEYFGSGVVHMGVQMQKVPDYSPRFFANAEVAVPPWLPDHPSVREDIAAAWSALHRLDQGFKMEISRRQICRITLGVDDLAVIFPSSNVLLSDQEG